MSSLSLASVNAPVRPASAPPTLSYQTDYKSVKECFSSFRQEPRSPAGDLVDLAGIELVGEGCFVENAGSNRYDLRKVFMMALESGHTDVVSSTFRSISAEALQAELNKAGSEARFGMLVRLLEKCGEDAKYEVVNNFVQSPGFPELWRKSPEVKRTLNAFAKSGDFTLEFIVRHCLANMSEEDA